jgi:hypothetical protein
LDTVFGLKHSLLGHTRFIGPILSKSWAKTLKSEEKIYKKYLSVPTLRGQFVVETIFMLHPISIVIPLYRENQVLRYLRHVDKLGASEVLLVDASENTTQIEPRSFRTKIRVIQSPPCRGIQLNLGAHLAKEENLFFLHADSLPPENALELCMETLQSHHGRVLGAFRFKLNKPNLRFQLLEWLTHIRCSLFHLPFGDQGFFTTKSHLKDLGWFLPVKMMEDFELARRAANYGAVKIRSEKIITSTRKWDKKGFWKVVAEHLKLQLKWLVFGKKSLRGFYPEKRMLQIFMKYPTEGRVKTRLAETIGHPKATKIYKWLVEKLFQNLSLSSLSVMGIDYSIFIDRERDRGECAEWLGVDKEKILVQSHGGLGDRLLSAHRNSEGQNAVFSCSIGTDCPDCDLSFLLQAFWHLSHKKIVIGPSFDGGYTLIGAQTPIPSSLFSDIPWSTEAVFEKTLQKIEEKNLSYGLLPWKMDIDHLDDLILYVRTEKITDDLPVKIPMALPAVASRARASKEESKSQINKMDSKN